MAVLFYNIVRLFHNAVVCAANDYCDENSWSVSDLSDGFLCLFFFFLFFFAEHERPILLLYELCWEKKEGGGGWYVIVGSRQRLSGAACGVRNKNYFAL